MKRNKNWQVYSILIFTVLFIAVSCAKIGSPFGGPKDEEPPKVIKTVPPDKSTNFVPRRSIVITFDEYIKLEDIFNELIISPPLEDRAVTQVKGTKLVVELPKDVTFDTTTYTISFGNSITDNNEGNILENYSYVFSLKDYLDSMSVEGRIVNSFDHKPSEERFLVMLYNNLNDSAPLLERPQYVDRTDQEGYFSINNIEIGQYRLFALRDANANLIFDLPDETIAFSDSLINLSPERFEDDIIIRDSALLARMFTADTIAVDSLGTDSIQYIQKSFTYFTEMVFFNQEVKNQYMTNYLRPQKEKLLLSFNEPIADSFSITPLNITPQESNWNLPDPSSENDTLVFWLTDTSMVNSDSLQFMVQYPIYDSLDKLIPRIDTLYFVVPKKELEDGRKRRGKVREEEITEVSTDKIEYIGLTANVRNRGILDLNKPVIISIASPIDFYRPDRIKFFRIIDTLEVAHEVDIKFDSNSMYRILIDFRPEEQTGYKIELLDSALTDIYGRTNDTTLLSFTTQAEDYYGVLSVHINNVSEPIIIQLLTEDEKILKQHFISSDNTINYPYLPPKTYLLKAIIDRNNNGIWDTGNYLQKIQPEQVVYYKNTLNVRANWEIDFNWTLDY